jgi:hypothetical protein
VHAGLASPLAKTDPYLKVFAMTLWLVGQGERMQLPRLSSSLFGIAIPIPIAFLKS